MKKLKGFARTSYLTKLAMLLAIVIIFTVFNIGNIPIGPIVATIYQVPVIIGAVILGVEAGTFLGGMWGLLCFFLALTGQTTDVVALATVQQNVFLYFVIAFVPRLLMGFLTGVLFKWLDKTLDKKLDAVSFAISGAVGSLFNTVLYLGALYIFIKGMLAQIYSIEIGAVGKMVLGVALSNGLVEAAVSCVIVCAVCKALSHTRQGKRTGE